MKSSAQLESQILSLDGKSYPAYKDLKGKWDFGSWILSIDHVQSDPFASPSSLTIEIEHPGFPRQLYENRPCRIALQDMLLRLFRKHLKLFVGAQSSKSGRIETAKLSQEIIERTVCRIDPLNGSLRFKILVGFPASGRRITARKLATTLCGQLPVLVKDSLIYDSMSQSDKQKLQEAYELACNQKVIREFLKENGFVAFVADGSVLPRESGASDLPMENALAFQSPKEHQITIEVPYGEPLTGLGLKEGVTVIAGGGYHGKSTLLEALEKGVYNHIASDGREYAICRDDAVKIRSEDGRAVHEEDISLFIRSLPTGMSVRNFVSEDASGSTSQAANVLEALEAGSRLLLIDEDACAANFMDRDAVMASIVSSDEEPIIPFSMRIRSFKDQGISTILAAGSSSSFFEEADVILQMKDYEPVDITAKAKEAAKNRPSAQTEPIKEPFALERIPLENDRYQDERIKIKTIGTDTLTVSREPIDLRFLEQIVDAQQAEGIGKMLVYAGKYLIDGEKTCAQIAQELESILSDKGPEYFGKGLFAAPRRYEILGALNRQRSQHFTSR